MNEESTTGSTGEQNVELHSMMNASLGEETEETNSPKTSAPNADDYSHLEKSETTTIGTDKSEDKPPEFQQPSVEQQKHELTTKTDSGALDKIIVTNDETNINTIMNIDSTNNPSDDNTFVLGHTTVDAQMEKVIDNIVELGGCQQFADTLERQTTDADRKKEVESIQREFVGASSDDMPQQPIPEDSSEVPPSDLKNKKDLDPPSDMQIELPDLNQGNDSTNRKSNPEDAETKLDTIGQFPTGTDHPSIQSRKSDTNTQVEDSPVLSLGDNSQELPRISEQNLQQSPLETSSQTNQETKSNDTKTSEFDLGTISKTEDSSAKSDDPKETARVKEVEDSDIQQKQEESSARKTVEPIEPADKSDHDVPESRGENSTRRTSGRSKALKRPIKSDNEYVDPVEEVNGDDVDDESKSEFKEIPEPIKLHNEAQVETDVKASDTAHDIESKQNSERPTRQARSRVPKRTASPEITNEHSEKKRKVQNLDDKQEKPPKQKLVIKVPLPPRSSSARKTIASSTPSTMPEPRRITDTSSSDFDVKKYRCEKCKYSTDRLNNIVYHKKELCTGFQQHYAAKVAAEVSAYIQKIQSPKGNSKRSSR